ncbi:glycosyltransferase family 4 protein [Sulfurimonas sp. NWX367]|uniref:glycosyltransferase family 4 protein n=1 Tax=unclassified Sulfurimonas TaxID=2623549 RepID=UPI00320480AC
MQRITLYVDITQFEQTRASTGIQRTLKEFLKGVLGQNKIKIKIFLWKEREQSVILLDNDEVKHFLENTKNYIFQRAVLYDIFDYDQANKKIFFDIDSAWNMPVKRESLYKKLKEKNFLIFNFIYDLTPILFPQYAYEETKKNFFPYLSAVFRYSDYVFCDSTSAKEDFLQFKQKERFYRDIPVQVVSLGSDFCKKPLSVTPKKYKTLLQSKYILFVGTLEPRKNHEEVLDVFTSLAQTYKELFLVFVGKEGWKVEDLVEKIQQHPLKNKRFFWLQNIDDGTLKHFYRNAFLVTYLSKYEGYGLPVVESLHYGNITIVSKNSSMVEVGREFADYILYENREELGLVLSHYCENTEDYRKRKEYIQHNFKQKTWKSFYNALYKTFLAYK